MNITSKRSIFSILIGSFIGVVIPTCWGPLIGVFVAAYLARVSTPKEGAKIGAIVVLPIIIAYFALQFPVQNIAGDNSEKLGNLLGLFLGLLLAAGVGALYGLIIGKLFQLTRDKGILF